MSGVYVGVAVNILTDINTVVDCWMRCLPIDVAKIIGLILSCGDLCLE